MRVRGLDLAAGAALIVLLGLGTWQVQRRAEKLDFIARHEAAMAAAAVPFPPESLWPSTDFSRLDLTKAEAEGHFLPLPEAHLFALLPKERKYGGVGWWVLMPFELRGGGIVFINRGFVPQEQKNPAARPKSLAYPGEQKIEGLVRVAEKPGRFTPQSSPQTNEWYLRDPNAFAKYDALDAAKVAPVVIDQLTPNPSDIPQASDGKLHIANNHLQYAITWYALAGVLAVIYILLRRRRGNAPARH